MTREEIDAEWERVWGRGREAGLALLPYWKTVAADCLQKLAKSLAPKGLPQPGQRRYRVVATVTTQVEMVIAADTSEAAWGLAFGQEVSDALRSQARTLPATISRRIVPEDP